MAKTTTSNDKISSIFGVTFEEFLKLADKDQILAIELISRRFGIGNKAFAKDFGVSREIFAQQVWDRLKLGRLSGGRQTQTQDAAYKRFQETGVGGIKVEVGKKPMPWTEVTEKVCIDPLSTEDLPEAQSSSNPSSTQAKTWIDLAAMDDEHFYAHLAKLYGRFIGPKAISPGRLARTLQIPPYTAQTAIPNELKERGLVKKHRALKADSETLAKRVAEFDRLAMAIENRYTQQRTRLDAMMPVNTLTFLKMSADERAFFIGAARVFYPAPTHAYSRALGLFDLSDTSIQATPHGNDVYATQVYKVTNDHVCQEYAGRRRIDWRDMTEATDRFLEELKTATDNMTAEERAEAVRLIEAELCVRQVTERGESDPTDVVDPIAPEPASEPESNLEPAPDPTCNVEAPSTFQFTDAQKQAAFDQLFALLTDDQKNELVNEWLAEHPAEKEKMASTQLLKHMPNVF